MIYRYLIFIITIKNSLLWNVIGYRRTGISKHVLKRLNLATISEADIVSVINRQGGFVGSISTFVESTSSGRSIRAVANFGAGDTILAIPKEFVLTKVNAAKTTYANELSDFEVYLEDSASYLALLLCSGQLDEENEFNTMSSKYIVGLLPRVTDLQHFPIYWSDNDLSELEGSPLLDLLSMRKAVIISDFEKLKKYSKSFSSEVSKEKFMWAHCTASSRTFSFNGDYFGYEVAMMVPFADMFNDKISPELDWDWDEYTDR